MKSEKRDPLLEREMRMIDCEEMSHYQTLMMGREADLSARKQMEVWHRKEQFGLVIGDRTGLANYRSMDNFKLDIQIFDRKRGEIHQLSTDELRSRHNERIREMEKVIDREIHRTGRDGW